MSLLQLKASNFRNFEMFHVEPSPDINIIFGENGSGKSSILEAITFLGLGRSFRTSLLNRVIQHGKDKLTVFGTVAQPDNQLIIPIGIEKNLREKIRIKMGSIDTAPLLADLARSLPLQLVNPDSYKILHDGPKERRRFLDWGMFHVEHRFYPVWQRFQRILKQRNAALQQGLPAAQLKSWDFELVAVAEELTLLRRDFVDKLRVLFFPQLATLIEISGLSLEYYQGWEEGTDLMQRLASNYQTDVRLGYTQFGPQKADLVIKLLNTPVQDVLSRGEQKLLVIALLLAQGVLLRQLTPKRCVYLLDDIAAELDIDHRYQVMRTLADLQAQVFITTADANVLNEMRNCVTSKLFHVEHGRIESLLNV